MKITDFGFTKKVGNDGTEKAQCIPCHQVLINLGLKPFKVKMHFATHGGSAIYGIEALKEK